MSSASNTHTLEQVADQLLPHRLRPDGLAFDGRTELVAVLTDASGVDIYRLGGQKAFHIDPDDLSGPATCLAWTQGGDSLLVGTAKGDVDTYTLRTGKTARGALLHPNRSNLQGAVNSIAAHNASFQRRSTRSHGHPPKRDVNQDSVEAWFEHVKDGDRHVTTPSQSFIGLPSLPLNIAQLNAADALPRLSPIPAPSKAGPGMPAPALRMSTKDIHLSLGRKRTLLTDSVEVTFTTREGGSTTGVINDIFRHEYASNTPTSEEHRVRQCTDPASGIHIVLNYDAPSAEAPGERHTMGTLGIYSVPFSQSGTLHTGTILHNANQLQLLEIYTTQCIETALLDWRTLTALPARFVSNINETLEGSQSVPLKDQLYQLLLSGTCSGDVDEWLKEELTERGQKRWDHALTTLHHSLRQLLEVNLLPALERAAIAASTLRGLATYYEGSKQFDVPPVILTNVLDAVGILQLLGHQALQVLQREECQFRAFSQWLRIQVDRASGEPGSQALTDLAEKEAMSTDIPVILSYLDTGFEKSRLEPYLGQRLPTQKSCDSYTLETVRESIRSSSASNDLHDSFLHFSLHLSTFQQRVQVWIAEMKKWQAKMWSPPLSVQLQSAAKVTPRDVSVDTAFSSGGVSSCVIVMSVGDEATSLEEHRVTVSRASKVATFTHQATSTRRVRLPIGHRVLDLKLLTGGDLILLVESDKGGQPNKLRAIVAVSKPTLARPDLTLSEDDLHVLVSFDHDKDWVPAQLLVSSSEVRSKLMVVDEQRRRWRVFRLPDSRGVTAIDSDANGAAEGVDLEHTLDGLLDGESMDLD